MGLPIDGERLLVNSSPRTPSGEQIDPEERPAERQLATSVPVTLNTGAQVGDLSKSEIDFSARAIDFALQRSSQCVHCRWHDKKAWHKVRDAAQLSNDPEARRFLNEVRAELLTTGVVSMSGFAPDLRDPNDIDVEAALAGFGLCPRLSEIYKGPVWIHEIDTCSGALGPDGGALDVLFEPRDRHAALASVAGYDAVLQAAQGNRPFSIFSYLKKK